MLRTLLSAVLILYASATSAHGINGHIHVTAWATVEFDEPSLSALFDDLEVFDALLIGASFPDSGYAIDAGYGEIAHWEPFVEGYIRYIRRTMAPPFETLAQRKAVAFLMGLAAHGLQDAIFDTLFLAQVERRDGVGQDATDPGIDAFLATDGHLRFTPEVYVPYDAVINVLHDNHGHDVEQATIQLGMERVKFFVIDSFEALAESFDEMYRPLMPWGSKHYLDPSIPGSLLSEVPATARYVEAIWDRLHGRFPVRAHIVHAYPSDGRRLLGRNGPHVDSWVTLIFGEGVKVSSIEERVLLQSPSGMPVPIQVAPTRWLGSPDDFTRLVVVKPQVLLDANSQYQVQLRSGLEMVSGVSMASDWRFSFETPCAQPDDEACPPRREVSSPPDVGGPAGPSMGQGAGASSSSTQAKSMDHGGMAVGQPGPVIKVAATSNGSNGCAVSPAGQQPLSWIMVPFLGLWAMRRKRSTNQGV